MNDHTGISTEVVFRRTARKLNDVPRVAVHGGMVQLVNKATATFFTLNLGIFRGSAKIPKVPDLTFTSTPILNESQGRLFGVKLKKLEGVLLQRVCLFLTSA